MANITSSMRVLDLFRKLNVAIRNFAEDVSEVAGKHEAEAPSAEIKSLMESLKAKHAVDEKDKLENVEMLRLLGKLLEDKRIFSMIEVETKEWFEFLDAIEKRLEMGKDTLTEEELETYEEIKSMTEKMKDFLRK